MLPGLLPIKPIITVAWSLSYEWFFYLTLPYGLGIPVSPQNSPRADRNGTGNLCSAVCSRRRPCERTASGICLWEL